MSNNCRVIMIGCSPSSPGGISSVISTYKRHGLFGDNVKYISSYNSPNKILVILNFTFACIKLIFNLIFFGVDIVHVHSASRGSFWRKYIFLKIASLFGVKTVFHLHSGEFVNFYSCQSLSVKKKIKSFLENVDLVIVLSPYWEKQLSNISKLIHTKVLFNPVDKVLDVFDRVSNQILFLGRLRKEKGVFELLESCKSLSTKGIDYHLILAGDGDLDFFEDKCKQLCIDENVTITGWVQGEEKNRYLVSSDIFVLPSYFEGLPIGVLEAMINNVVVVASSVGGIPDVIVDKKHGLLVEPMKVEPLASALESLLIDEPLKEELRKDALDRALRYFDTNKIIAKLNDYYFQLKG